MESNWIAVASADHVRAAQVGGFMQVCHGKAGPLRRITPGSRIAYYSPSRTFHGRGRLQAFTAFGTVANAEPYEVELARGFRPLRRAVAWCVGQDAPIQPLLPQLSLTASRRWGQVFRYGIIEISDEDMDIIAHAMGATPSLASEAA